MGDAELTDGPLETGVALGGLSAIGAIAAYQGNWTVVGSVITVLGAYLMSKAYATREKSPPQ